jgi:hypothetical protein
MNRNTRVCVCVYIYIYISDFQGCGIIYCYSCELVVGGEAIPLHAKDGAMIAYLLTDHALCTGGDRLASVDL